MHCLRHTGKGGRFHTWVFADGSDALQEPLTDYATVMSEILTDTDPVRGMVAISATDGPAEINALSAQRAFGPGAVINDFDGVVVIGRTVRHFAVDASESPVVATFFGGLPDAPQGPWRPASVLRPACHLRPVRC
jgi:hypothetical protein